MNATLLAGHDFSWQHLMILRPGRRLLSSSSRHALRESAPPHTESAAVDARMNLLLGFFYSSS